MDIEKQITYWKGGADSDLETAELLIMNKKIIQGLFFCHLCIEKIIKALVVKTTTQVPPKSHDLSYLLDKTGIIISDEQTKILSVLMIFQLEGRYPEYYPTAPSSELTSEYFSQTKKLLQCLKEKL